MKDEFDGLKASAESLNSITDSLGREVTELNEIIKNLHLGVSAWVPLGEPHTEFGYARVGGRWGLAVREREGEGFTWDVYHFNEAPRRLRVNGVATLLALLEKLQREADTLSQRLLEAGRQAQEMVDTLRGTKS